MNPSRDQQQAAPHDWREFWGNYRNRKATSLDDLFVQVGQTVQRLPIPQAQFKILVSRIIEKLELSRDDDVLDLCCGNGLISYEIAACAKSVAGVDFSRHLIQSARELRPRNNIEYLIGDVISDLPGILKTRPFPQRILMSFSLAYFTPAQFASLLGTLTRFAQGRPFRFVITQIPRFELKENFYSTPERMARHLACEKEKPDVNDGLGRWWRADEIVEICRSAGLRAEIENQPPLLSNYRMDALITNANDSPDASEGSGLQR